MKYYGILIALVVVFNATASEKKAKRPLEEDEEIQIAPDEFQEPSILEEAKKARTAHQAEPTAASSASTFGTSSGNPQSLLAEHTTSSAQPTAINDYLTNLPNELKMHVILYLASSATLDEAIRNIKNFLVTSKSSEQFINDPAITSTILKALEKKFQVPLYVIAHKMNTVGARLVLQELQKEADEHIGGYVEDYENRELYKNMFFVEYLLKVVPPEEKYLIFPLLKEYTKIAPKRAFDEQWTLYTFVLNPDQQQTMLKYIPFWLIHMSTATLTELWTRSISTYSLPLVKLLVDFTQSINTVFTTIRGKLTPLDMAFSTARTTLDQNEYLTLIQIIRFLIEHGAKSRVEL